MRSIMISMPCAPERSEAAGARSQPGRGTPPRWRRTTKGVCDGVSVRENAAGPGHVLGVIVVAAALLVIPISYERTVGYDVSLTLAGGNLPEAQVREIAAPSRRRWGLRV
jgi:hypothetical protein